MANPESEAKALVDIKKIIIDFTTDILVTFPEQRDTLNVNLKTLLEDTDQEDKALLSIYAHCKKIYPERFFDILYQNNEVFKNKIEFLPGMDFSLLWADKDLSDKSRETIWKYLQLLLFTLVSTISDGASFGDTAKLFEAIDEDEFKNKLEETISQMQNVFSGAGTGTGTGTGETGTDSGEGASETGAAGSGSAPNINLEDLPDPKDIHDHVAGMMNGKLGNLAREIAEETAADLNMDMENAGSVNDVFKKLFQNPTKLMSLVKNVGNKLDSKLKSGDMKESELLQEASDIMQKMKSMPGMGDLQSMLAKMGMGHMMPGGKGGGKVNVNAMQSNLDRNLKAAKNKERLLANLEKRQNEKQAASRLNSASSLHSVGVDKSGRENLVFSKGEEVERSGIVKPTANKKKNKKKKNKTGAGASGAGAIGAGAITETLEDEE
jgi:hypothetical protein